MISVNYNVLQRYEKKLDLRKVFFGYKEMHILMQ